jgi:two-component system sensor histidine kinase PilS (NtrC family)
LRRSQLEFLRPSFDGPTTWLWFVGAARIIVLLIVAAGAIAMSRHVEYTYLLVAIFFGAFVSGGWYLIALRQAESLPAVLTWTQLFVDFGVVAATISFTGGQASFFNFLLVIVILEAGVLLGLMQGFVFASLATVYMLMLTIFRSTQVADPLAHWYNFYNFLIQAIAFYFTAFISGYWHQRVSRMKQFQRDILDNLNSGFLITDEHAVVVAINKSACRILNLVEGNVVGRHVDGILRPDSGAECPVTTAIRSERDFTSYEFYARTGPEEVKLIGLTTNRIANFKGQVTGMIASFSDLTEMARMRQELQRQDRLAVVGELAAGLAHEIRNPVAAIRGSVDEMRNSIEQPELIKRLAAIAIRESDHLNDIVTSFLDFARNPAPKRDPQDIGEMVQEVQDRLRLKYAHAGALRIATQLSETPLFVTGDHTQLCQVFMNLGQNAIEAMDEQGTLTITVTGARPIEVRFDDEGPGIAPDKVARIFEPFYTEKEGGVGMGLAICHRIVTAHDGTIQAAARPGGGTSMIVRLPAVSGEER